MWKVQVQHAVREIRFVLKPAAQHHGAWRFVQKRLADLRSLNQNTFFAVDQIPDEFDTPSAIHFIYGDREATIDDVFTDGLSYEAVEQIFKDKVKLGLSLPRAPMDSRTPHNIVEAHKYVRHLHDSF